MMTIRAHKECISPINGLLLDGASLLPYDPFIPASRREKGRNR